MRCGDQGARAFGAKVLTAYAYDVEVSADVILSFSVFEHVFRRDRYVASIGTNLREEGWHSSTTTPVIS